MEKAKQINQMQLGQFFKGRANLNYENVPEEINAKNEKKHEVSHKTLKTLEKVMLQQDEYGMNKYKKPLAYTMHYDWLAMFLEEMADGLKYIQNEIDKKTLVIEILKCGLEGETPKYHIEHALKLLTIQGTGK